MKQLWKACLKFLENSIEQGQGKQTIDLRYIVGKEWENGYTIKNSSKIPQQQIQLSIKSLFDH